MEETTERRAVFLEANQALIVRERYVCAKCWGHLNVYFTPGEADGRVTCDQCGDGSGFVTKRFAERRRQASRGEAIEVRELLARIGVTPHVVRTAEELLAEIGTEG
jgi:hypothetical protein